MENNYHIIKTQLPNGSILKQVALDCDYIDSYETTINTNKKLTTTDIAIAFHKSSADRPKWIRRLMKIRNAITSLFGLKDTQIDNTAINDQTFEIGKKLGMFEIFDRLDNELILGKNDKHLNFRISALTDNNQVSNETKLTLSTVVKYNNFFGKLYFIPVKPFHKLIVPVMLKGIAKHLQT